MPIRSSAGIKYFTFNDLGEGVVQAIISRHGGVSPEPWATLNLGGTVGDEQGRVRENRNLALKALQRDPGSVYDVWQVHGINVAIAEAPRAQETPPVQADTILSNTPGITLMMRFADCVPILLHDPVRKVVGIAHAGWMGTVRGTVKAAVEAMQERFRCRPKDIRAGIGPSIGPDHYEIGADVISQVRQAFGTEASGLLKDQAGVDQIEPAGICTACHTEDWYSHRAEHGRTGRFGAIIALDA
jgi:YfiH family protein